MAYPNVQRNDWHESHDYTLWLNDSTQMRLTSEQYECLKFSVDRIAELEAPLTIEQENFFKAELARAQARMAQVPEWARPKTT